MPGRKQGGYSQATRLLKLLDVLQASPSGVAVSALCERFDVHPKSLTRDRQALAAAGYETETLESTSPLSSRVRLVQRKNRLVSLSLAERYALLAARRMFDALRDTPLHEQIQSVYAKLTQTLDEKQQASQEALDERFVVLPDQGTKHYAKTATLDALLEGVLYRSRVDFQYRKPDGAQRRGVLEPYAIVLYKQGLYVIGQRVVPEGEAQEGEARAVAVFAAERFVRATRRYKDHFEVPATFRVDDHFQGAFGIFTGGEVTDVTIDFTRDVAYLIRARRWHPTQKLKTLKDGGVRLSMRIANPTQLISWVLGWGPQATLVAPAGLVTEIKRQIAATSRHYR